MTNIFFTDAKNHTKQNQSQYTKDLKMKIKSNFPTHVSQKSEYLNRDLRKFDYSMELLLELKNSSNTKTTKDFIKSYEPLIRKYVNNYSRKFPDTTVSNRLKKKLAELYSRSNMLGLNSVFSNAKIFN